MTVNQLINKLQKLKIKHGRSQVLIMKDTLQDGNGCWNCCRINSVNREWVHTSDDDGGVKINKNGSESGRVVILLKG